MPVTPLHMGPGLAIKAVGGRHFSLMVFGFSQVLIDIEPVVRILRDDAVLHGFTHTYLGATLIAVASIVVGRPVCQRLLDYFEPDPDSAMLVWLRGPKMITWPAAISGALIGTYSHVLLDSVMHSDMAPLAPLSQVNTLVHLISVDALHLLCVASGLAGAALLGALFLLRRKPLS